MRLTSGTGKALFILGIRDSPRQAHCCKYASKYINMICHRIAKLLGDQVRSSFRNPTARVQSMECAGVVIKSGCFAFLTPPPPPQRDQWEIGALGYAPHGIVTYTRVLAVAQARDKDETPEETSDTHSSASTTV